MRAMHTNSTHVVLNAHLLTAQEGYRSAGINGYIYNLIRALPDADPSFTYTVFTGSQGQPPTHVRLKVRRTSYSTENPLRRILWEQLVQPSALRQGHFDLAHALAFVRPLFSQVPFVVTVYYRASCIINLLPPPAACTCAAHAAIDEPRRVDCYLQHRDCLLRHRIRPPRSGETPPGARITAAELSGQLRWRTCRNAFAVRRHA
jgi:hypothetical protein